MPSPRCLNAIRQRKACGALLLVMGMVLVLTNAVQAQTTPSGGGAGSGASEASGGASSGGASGGTSGGEGLGGLMSERRVIYGELDRSKPTLDGGEFYERHEFELSAGDRIDAEVFSEAFDTFLAVVSPSGRDVQNDDWEDDPQRSRVILEAEEAGTWTVLVTSFSSGEVGAYTLTIALNGPDTVDDGTIRPQDVAVPDGQRVIWQQIGHLGAKSPRSPVRGEPYDTWELAVEAGQALTITMSSKDLDSFLAVFPPAMAPMRNDDGSSDVDAQVSFVVAESGTMLMHAASYDVEAVGEYSLTVSVADGQLPEAVGPVTRTALDTLGRLQRGDKTREGGQFVNRYEFEAQAGETIRVQMNSSVVDPHLFLVSPSGASWENDDDNARIDQSVIEVVADEAGVYRATASSFAAGEAGEYRLAVTVTTPSTGSVPSAVPPVAPSVTPPAAPLAGGAGGLGGPDGPGAGSGDPRSREPDSALGGSAPAGSAPGEPGLASGGAMKIVGRLGDEDDEVAPTREFYDLHPFEAQAGQRYRIVLASDAFDTYLEVTGSGGKIWENDDDTTNASQSKIEIEATESGVFSVRATSFYPQEKGDYVLTIERID